MKTNHSFNEILVTAVCTAFVVTFVILSLANVPSLSTKTVQAAESVAPGQGYTMYARPRGRGTQENETFIFYNEASGDIFVYHNEEMSKHYRLRRIGQDLQKVGN